MKTTILFLATLFMISVAPKATAQGIEAEEMAKILFEKSSVGISAGYGWKSNDSNNTSTFCIGADYLHKVNKNDDCGAYLGGFGSFHNSSQDDFSKNIFKLGGKFEYRIPINEGRDTQLVGGIKAFYKTGSQENFNFEEDVTGYGAILYSGLNVRLSSKWSVGLDIPIIRYSETTFKADGNETNENNTSIALNKRNPVMAYARRRF